MNSTKLNAWRNSGSYKAGVVKARTRQLNSAHKIAASAKSTPDEKAAALKIIKKVQEK